MSELPDQSRTPKRWIEWSILGVIVLVGLLCRAPRVGWDAISWDENWHMALSTGQGSPQLLYGREMGEGINVPSPTLLRDDRPWWTPWMSMRGVVHPPLYVSVLRIWREVVGEGDIAAQWLSVVCSLGAIVLTWHAGRTSISPAAGLWAALVMAVAPTQVFMAQEVRGYALLLLLGCWALSAAARIEERGYSRVRAAELSAAALGMMLTHYFAIGACIAIALWAIFRPNRGAMLRIFGWLALSAILYAIVWLPLAVLQLDAAREATQLWLTEPTGRPVPAAMFRLASTPVRLLAEMPMGNAGVGVGVVVMLGMVYPLYRDRRLILYGLWFVCVIGLLVGLDVSRGTRHLAFIRYALLASPGLYLLACGAAWVTRPIIGHVAGGLAVVAGLMLSSTAYVPDGPDYRLLRAAIVELRDAAGPHDQPALVFSSIGSSEEFLQATFLAAGSERSLWPARVLLQTQPTADWWKEEYRARRAIVVSVPYGSINDLLPGATLLDVNPVTDANGRLIAVVTLVNLGPWPRDRRMDDK